MCYNLGTEQEKGSKRKNEVNKMKKTMEKRIVVDANGFELEQIRFLPVEDWELNDGWRTTRIIGSSKS